MPKQSKIETTIKELHRLIVKHKSNTTPEIIKLQKEVDWFWFGGK